MSADFDLLIRGGELVTGTGRIFADLAVSDGRIAGIFRSAAAVSAEQTIDASNLLVMPGGIETHTHIRWPHDDQLTVDDWESATRSAVLGGTTTVVDFVPPGGGSLVDRCQARREEAAAGSVIDFAFHPILTGRDVESLEQIGKVISDGFTSFKMYTTYEDRRVDDGAAWLLMETIAAHGGLPGFHAENHEVLCSALAAQVRAGHVDVESYPKSRPGLAEAETIQMVSLYARKLGTPVYIFHVSGSEALGAVSGARAAGTQVYAETCSHYLTFDESVFAGPEAWRFVISPPIRAAADREALWRGIVNGTVVSVGSDHCAYDRDVKRASADDHRRIPAGAPGIEARTPSLWQQATQRGIEPEIFVQVSSERAGRVLGLPQKGTLSVGSDADIVLWDPTMHWTGDSLPQASESTFSLYDAQRGSGLPRHVLIRGVPVVRDGEFIGGAPFGRFLSRHVEGAGR